MMLTLLATFTKSKNYINNNVDVVLYNHDQPQS